MGHLTFSEKLRDTKVKEFSLQFMQRLLYDSNSLIVSQRFSSSLFSEYLSILTHSVWAKNGSLVIMSVALSVCLFSGCTFDNQMLIQFIYHSQDNGLLRNKKFQSIIAIYRPLDTGQVLLQDRAAFRFQIDIQTSDQQKG